MSPPGTMDATQASYERRQEREKHMQRMSEITTGVLADDMDVDSIPLDDGPNDERTSMNQSNQTFENARRFLWDEDDEFEDDPYYSKGSAGDSSSQNKKKKGAGIFPLSLSPRFQSDRGDASPAMYGEDAEAGFSTIDIRSSLGNDFHRAYRKSFVHHRSNGSKGSDRVSYMGGVFTGCFYYLCRPCLIMKELCRGASQRQRLLLTMAAVFLALSIFGIVVLAVAASSGGGSSSPHPINSERYESLRTMVLDSGITHQITLDNGNTAQSKALLWLTDKDPAKLEVEDDRLLQRYVVATFFFSTYNVDSSSSSSDGDSPDSGSSGSSDVGTNGVLTPQWNKTFHWMTEYDVCSWHGIRCDGGKQPQKQLTVDNGRHIKDLNLTMNSVEGTIPSELAALEHLRALDLSGNALFGTLPPALGNLQHLAHLELGDNLLSGTIPNELTQCKKLRFFSLDRNMKLHGTLPTGFDELTELRYFGVHWNELSGPLLDATKLTNLEILEQGENEFTGTIPTEYGALFNLKELRLRENKLVGTIPSELGVLSNLETLHYSHNELTGTIPTTIAGLTLLVDFRFQHNTLHGPLPSEIGLLTNLGNLNMEDNELTGTLPATMKHLKHLHSFRFFRNNFSGSVPSEFCASNRATPFKILAGDCAEDDDPRVDCPCCTQCHGFK